MPATRSLEESAGPQARAPEISDLGPSTSTNTGSRRRRGFALDIEASHAPVMTDIRLVAISSLRSRGSDLCAGHGGRETVRIECTGVPSVALAR
ncbi:unnamed protein product [Trichogramma brassicae]|uniref:Uncharacterized protein n=1 Tax=Trichogramma brassicae TaxID=86971 RepID=A0A6H5IJ65_9HYME|nr:unnamed protein product [Trichogramma brassicae]